MQTILLVATFSFTFDGEYWDGNYRNVLKSTYNLSTCKQVEMYKLQLFNFQTSLRLRLNISSLKSLHLSFCLSYEHSGFLLRFFVLQRQLSSEPEDIFTFYLNEYLSISQFLIQFVVFQYQCEIYIIYEFIHSNRLIATNKYYF